ncbi:bifunctional diaminohydroxyphosphoribosylaminopyrimidine deaminase/5-amino-6-(5-phosphoribosylamino)uracil reductase RibD [bacterium]|nr:bifunctional diaminohydroxyphosphoribosylaminopyrimidine deaminase/5-amino-6-(5-phosphoribosylamino)uracil reductase RibD [bacterium]
MAWSTDDTGYMQLCFDLARRAEGQTSPNPMVGAVLVKDGSLIGQGYHHHAGAAHAEIEAINSSTTDPTGATLYVNLEPCCCYGKTPPCTSAIIEQKIARVVIATVDPNPKVSGAGIAQLHAAGIQVDSGLLEQEAKAMNEVFFKYISTDEPFCILKSAVSLDGKIATVCGKSRWISSPESRTDVHLLRRNLDAVMVGIETVLADDPELTVRHVPVVRKQPDALIIDPFLRIPLSARLLQQIGHKPRQQARKVYLIASEAAPAYKLRSLRQQGIECLLFESDRRGRLSLKNVFRNLAQRGITSILLEGGPTLAASALRAEVIDKIIYYIAPKIIGDHAAAGPVNSLGVIDPAQAIPVEITSVTKLGNDLKVVALVRKEA